jgi:integrase
MPNILQDFENRKQSVGQMQIIIAILQEYNCRSAEVLSAEWANFYPDKFLILKGCKRSANVIVRDKLILKTISEIPKLHPTIIFNQVNYQALYWYCKTRYSHLFAKFKGKKNRKITHGFRFAAVEFINDEAYIRDILFHRSVKSGRFYKLKKGVSNDTSKKNKSII